MQRPAEVSHDRAKHDARSEHAATRSRTQTRARSELNQSRELRLWFERLEPTQTREQFVDFGHRSTLEFRTSNSSSSSASARRARARLRRLRSAARSIRNMPATSA